MHGKLLSEQNNKVTLNAHEVKMLNKVILPSNTDQVFFLRLILKDQEGTIDENLYWLTNKKHSYEKLNELEKVTPITLSLKEAILVMPQLKFPIRAKKPPFSYRLKVLNNKDELVLPSFFTENYFTLLPGDIKKVDLDFSSVVEKCRQRQPEAGG